MTGGDKGLQRVTRGYKGLHGVTRDYSNFFLSRTFPYDLGHGNTGGYKESQGLTRAYRGFQRIIETFF